MRNRLLALLVLPLLTAGASNEPPRLEPPAAPIHVEVHAEAAAPALLPPTTARTRIRPVATRLELFMD
jgi:hypothetical protein